MMALQRQANGMSLRDLLAGLAAAGPVVDLPITGLSMDSRRVRPGDLFLACRGERASGERFIGAAVSAGAVAVALEAGLDAGDRHPVPVIPVVDLPHRAGIIGARFHGHPARDLDVIGITGTNGKTSVACYLAAALSAHDGIACGLLGTLGYGRYGQLRPALNTTPDALTLQQHLADFRDQGLARVVMEVSSHGLDQGRIAGVEYHTAVFTNLSSDHLDYHGDMETYGAAKKRLFQLPGLRHGVINGGDEYGDRLLRELAGRLPLYRYRVVDDFSAPAAGERELVEAVITGGGIARLELEIRSPWGAGRLVVPFGGRFNAHNLLACLTCLVLLGVPFPAALEHLSASTPVPGRLEPFGGEGKPLVIVDYAHTPDALAQVLVTLRQHCPGRLVCVFGCGGDRDRGKRPQMGAIAEQYADHIILTSDNPRLEDPDRIIRDIAAGISDRDRVVIQADRAQAIAGAVQAAGAGDVVLVAGKGHETYQDAGGRRYPFSDRQLVRQLLGDGH